MTETAAVQQNPSMLMAALAYAKTRGWKVFPTHNAIVGADGVARCSCAQMAKCSSIGKHPRTEHGVKNATTDEVVIRDWWKQWPHANIGVAAGKASGFWVLDVDSAKGGDDSLLELQCEHEELPATVEALTGGGGRHLLFTMPGVPVRNRVGFAPGLDTRSDGGYIVVSPSLHPSGRRYAWESSSRPTDVQIADAPQWLLELVIGAPGEQLRDVRPIAEADLPDLNGRLFRARRYLAKIPGAVSGEGGHLQTWIASIALVRGFALPEHAALDLLTADYNPRCSPKWELKELEHKVATAAKDGRRPLGYLLGDRPLDVDGYPDDERAAIREEPKVWCSPIERARRLGGSGVRLPTGLDTFDRATRGGPSAGKLIVFGGAPGAGKTTLGVQLARHYAKQGTAVAIFAADEDADGLLIRWGQSEGIERDALEMGNDDARARLADAMADLPKLLLVDADEEGATVEDVAERLSELAGGAGGVLVLDSLQTLRTRKSDAADNPRARIDEAIATLKRAAKERGHLVLATCELSRGAYRSQNAADRIDDLAAFKESGGIEYGATTLLVLRSVKGEEDLVDVTMPKNRLGQKLAFRLKLNFRLAEFSEVPMPEEDHAADNARAEEVIAARARDRILRALRERTDLRSMNAVSREARGNKNENLLAIRELLEEAAVSKVDGVFRVTATAETGAQS